MYDFLSSYLFTPDGSTKTTKKQQYKKGKHTQAQKNNKKKQ